MTARRDSVNENVEKDAKMLHVEEETLQKCIVMLINYINNTEHFT